MDNEPLPPTVPLVTKRPVASNTRTNWRFTRSSEQRDEMIMTAS